MFEEQKNKEKSSLPNPGLYNNILAKNKYFWMLKCLFLSDFAENYSLIPNKSHLNRLKRKKDMVEPNLFG